MLARSDVQCWHFKSLNDSLPPSFGDSIFQSVTLQSFFFTTISNHCAKTMHLPIIDVKVKYSGRSS